MEKTTSPYVRRCGETSWEFQNISNFAASFRFDDCGEGQGGGSLGEQGVGGVREMGEESAGSGISTRAGSGREIQKGKRSLSITAYHPVKNTNPATFLTSI